MWAAAALTDNADRPSGYPQTQVRNPLARVDQSCYTMAPDAFRANPHNIGIATPDEAAELFQACDRCLLLAWRESSVAEASKKCKSLPLFSPETWPLALDMILNREL